MGERAALLIRPVDFRQQAIGCDRPGSNATGDAPEITDLKVGSFFPDHRSGSPLMPVTCRSADLPLSPPLPLGEVVASPDLEGLLHILDTAGSASMRDITPGRTERGN